MQIMKMPLVGRDRSLCTDGNGFVDDGNNVFLNLMAPAKDLVKEYKPHGGKWTITFRNKGIDWAVSYASLEDALKDWWRQVARYYMEF